MTDSIKRMVEAVAETVNDADFRVLSYTHKEDLEKAESTVTVKLLKTDDGQGKLPLHAAAGTDDAGKGAKKS